MIAGLLIGWSAVTAVQAPDASTSAAEPMQETDGIWPSPKLMNLLLERWADRMSDELGLSEAQRPAVREAVARRWSTFLSEHRDDLKPLFNEFLEMRLDRNPPTKEQVQEWAERARPAFEVLREEVREGTDEFRQMLTPLQRAKFEVQALQMGVGMQVADQRLKQLESGVYDVNDIWNPPGREGRRGRRDRRRGRDGERDKAAATAPDDARDPVAAELDAWDQYVAEFARTYALDEGQRDAAGSCLSELKQRAIGHRDTHREEIDRLEARISGFTGSDPELADLKQQLTRLYGPVDDMFKELQRRIEPIPTAEQRARAVNDAAASRSEAKRSQRATDDGGSPPKDQDE